MILYTAISVDVSNFVFHLLLRSQEKKMFRWNCIKHWRVLGSKQPLLWLKEKNNIVLGSLCACIIWSWIIKLRTLWLKEKGKSWLKYLNSYSYSVPSFICCCLFVRVFHSIVSILGERMDKLSSILYTQHKWTTMPHKIDCQIIAIFNSW